MARGFARLDAFVDQTTQRLEQTGGALHLVDDREPAALRAQITTGVRKLFQIRRIFQIQVQSGFGGLASARQSRLAHLARAKQGDGGKLTQPLSQTGIDLARDHGL